MRWRRRLPVLATAAVLGVSACSDATMPTLPTSVTVSATDLSFSAIGRTAQLSATVLDQTGSAMPGEALIWTSSNPAVATVSASGLVTATGNGSAFLTVSAGSASRQVDVTVAQVPAVLLLSQSDVSFTALADTLTLSVVAMDSMDVAIASPVLTWVALDTAVARVSPGGRITAVGNGATSVAAISGPALAAARVAVEQRPSALALSTDSIDFASLGDTLRVSAMATDAGGFPVASVSVAWSSTDTTVAKVSTSGLVRAIGNGTTTLVAVSEQASHALPVVVAQRPGSVALQPDSVVLPDPGDRATLAATVRDAGGSPIVAAGLVWSSSDEGIVRVDPAGVVEAVATGTAVVSATAGGVVGQVSVRVVPELTLLPASPTSVTVEVATPVALSVRAESVLGGAYAGATVSWLADPGSGAITSETTTASDGTGHAGAVWLLGTAAGAQAARARLTSRGHVVEVVFNAMAAPGPPVSATLVADSVLLSARGETAYLYPTYRDAYDNTTSGSSVVWTSRDPSVASVASDGLVTGGQAGAAWVVGTLGSAADSLLVTVQMRGAITITFDDGWDTAYDNAFPVFQQFNLRGNVAVNPAQVGLTAYMTEAELDQLDAAGFSIVSHTMSHDSLTTLTVGELDYELRASREWIEARGYQGANVFIVPYHDWSTRERNAIAGYYEAARGLSASFVSPDSLVAWKPLNPYELTGIEADLLPYTTVQGRDRLRTILQRTADEGAFIDVFFHHMPTANVADFQATLAVIDEFRDRVLPYHELYPIWARTIY